MSEVSVKKFAGLYSHPNPLSQVPEGALKQADDCVIDREGIIENRRGFDFFDGTGSSALGSSVNKFLEYKKTLLTHYGTTLARDNGGSSLTNYSGSYSAPDATSRIRGEEKNGSLFFVTSEGVKKLDSLTGTPAAAGLPKGLDIAPSFAASAKGFMPYDTQVAYRMLWGIKDANSIETLGTPSSRAEIANALINISSVTRASSTVTVTTDKDHGLAVNDIVDILNVEAFASVTSLTYNTTSHVVTVTTAAAHNLTSPADLGRSVTIRGCDQSEFNGTFSIATIPTGTTFTYTIKDSTVTAPTGFKIEYGVDTNGYSGTFIIGTVPTSTTFTYTIATTPVTPGTAISGKTMSVGKYRDVSLVFPVPSDITTNHFYQVYRSEYSASASVPAFDELQLVYEAKYVSGSTVTVTDIVPDELRGQNLYTNQSEQGIAQSNDRPPFAKDIALYKSFMHYANTKTPQKLLISLVGVDGITRNTDTVTINGEVYTFSSAEDVGNKKFRLFADIAGTIAQVTGTATFTTASSIPHGLAAGDQVFITGAADTRYNGTFTVKTVPTSTTFTYTVDSAAAASAGGSPKMSTGSPSQNIADTAKSLVKVVNRGSSTLYGFYVSNPDDVPGEMLFEARLLSAAQFSAISTAGASTKFNPQLPTSGTTVSSDNEVVANRLYNAKSDQPDSVPALSYKDIGPRDKAILRIVALRDSLFIIKEDGIYRRTGEDERSFVDLPFDTTVICLAPESVVKLNNTIYMYTNKGVVSVNDSGVSPIPPSHPIEKDILPLRTYLNSSSLMHATSYEADNKYILWVQTTSTASTTDACYVYNTMTDAWTYWKKPARAALVIDDVLYLGNTYTNSILKERKSQTKTDHKDEAVTATINTVAADGLSCTVTYSYGGLSLVPGCLITQSSNLAKVTAVSGTTLTLDRNAGLVPGSCTISQPIKYRWNLLPQVAGAPGIMKHFRECQIYPENDEFTTATMLFASDLSNITKEQGFSFPNRELGFGGSGWGEEPWGDDGEATGATPLRTLVPQGIQRCRSLLLGLAHSVANEKVSFLNASYVFEPGTERTTK